MQNNPYKPPEDATAPECRSENRIALVLLWIAASLIILVNLSVSPARKNDLSLYLAYVVGHDIIFPMLVTALFQIKRKFRNSRSRIKIFIWASLLTLFLNLAQP